MKILKNYITRNEIEKIIKEENINRDRFYEYFKFKYNNIITKFYYMFCDDRNFTPSEIVFSHHRFHIRNNLKIHAISGFLQSNDWADYLNKIKSEIITNSKLYFITDGWVYEGYQDEIFKVLYQTGDLRNDFFIISKKFD